MPVIIEPYRKEHEPAVEAFNTRMKAGGAKEDQVFFREATPSYLPKSADCSIYHEYFVALEDGTVRGGYGLKRQAFTFPDKSIRDTYCYNHAISEGIVSKSYARLGGMLLMHALRQQPLLFALGMGGYGRPLPNMLIKLGWAHHLVPFYLRVLRPYRFLRQMEGLRTSPFRQFAMDAVAYTGIGWIGFKALHLAQRLRTPRVEPFSVQEFSEFGRWVDPLWENSKGAYGWTAVRDAESLRTLYPPTLRHLTRLRVSRDGVPIGWAVVGERRKNPRWGDLRVGTIVDCWAAPEMALTLIRAATEALEPLGFDALVSNQSHEAWCRALENSGFFKASSNFLFAGSTELAHLLQPFEQQKSRMHLTRGDADGLPWAY